jgi:hypothetical protein
MVAPVLDTLRGGTQMEDAFDDEKLVADSFAMISNSSGYQATAAYSGEAGI